MAAMVESEVDCGICITLATNRLRVAADKIIKTACAVRKSTGIMPLLSVFATALPKTNPPARLKIRKSPPARHRFNARLPYAVAKEPAKLGAPILMEKKTAISRMIKSDKLMACQSNREHRDVMKSAFSLDDFFKSHRLHCLKCFLFNLLPNRCEGIRFILLLCVIIITRVGK